MSVDVLEELFDHCRIVDALDVVQGCRNAARRMRRSDQAVANIPLRPAFLLTDAPGRGAHAGLNGRR